MVLIDLKKTRRILKYQTTENNNRKTYLSVLKIDIDPVLCILFNRGIIKKFRSNYTCAELHPEIEHVIQFPYPVL